jgi:hypothetical protein
VELGRSFFDNRSGCGVLPQAAHPTYGLNHFIMRCL